MKSTFMQSKETVTRNWYVLDAKDMPLGRVASKAAVLLRGKHKVTFTPHVDCGDYVIIVNADKVALTSETLNLITDGKANITANEYELKAKHYIGGIANQDYFVKTVMENYTPVKAVPEKSYLNIEGGKVTKLETGDTGYAFVRANKNMNLNGVNANGVNVAAGGDIKIEDNVISVDGAGNVVGTYDSTTENLTLG